MANFCPGILWSIIWLLILWFFMWPVASFLSFWYILFLPFAACVPCLKTVCEKLIEWINLCEVLGQKIRGMEPLCA